MKTKSDKVYKGMVFAGCSFTWGQGLYYYSNLPTLKEPPPDAYNSQLVMDSHNLFRKTLYFPRLVANHFNTFEICKIENGGSEQTSLDYLRCVFTLDAPNTGFYMNRHSFDEIEYLVFQFSQPQRNTFYYMNYNDRTDKTDLTEFRAYSPETHEKFYKYLAHQRKTDFDSWMEEHTKKWANIIKQNLQFYESKGVKTLMLNWETDYLKYIKEDEWLNERMVKLDYNGKEYECIRQIMNENSGFTINNDYDNFDITPGDHHPSKKCHKIIADSVIKKIELQDVDYTPLINKEIEYLRYDNIIENLHPEKQISNNKIL